jgi:hypothetical protein
MITLILAARQSSSGDRVTPLTPQEKGDFSLVQQTMATLRLSCMMSFSKTENLAIRIIW